MIMMTTPIMFLSNTCHANVDGENRSSATPWPAMRATSIPVMPFPVQVRLQLITPPGNQHDHPIVHVRE